MGSGTNQKGTSRKAMKPLRLIILEQQQQKRHQFKWMHAGDRSRFYDIKKKVKPEVRKEMEDANRKRISNRKDNTKK